MKVYKIKVNGKVYEVEVEVCEKDGNISREEKSNEAPKSSQTNKSEGDKIEAPMQGNVLSIKVSKGSKVNSGEVLMILEAMKMENEILAPRDCVIEDILVSEGKTVNNKDVMFIIR